MKRALSLLLAVAFLCGLLPVGTLTANAAEYSGTCGENLVWTLDETTGVLTISGTGEMSDYPNYMANAPWHESRAVITAVVIEDGVTSIGACAFLNCDSLAEVTIPNSVTSIGGGAFSNTALYQDESNWTNGVLYIGNWLIAAQKDFAGEYTIPSGVGIAAGAFFGCASLTEVVIPHGVTNIAEDVFCECTGLTAVTIPDSVVAIGESAFSGCDSLTAVEIPYSVAVIGESAFSFCGSLTDLKLSEGLTTIGDRAFYSCKSLSSVVIPYSVTAIETMAFYFCLNLKAVYFRGNAPEIAPYVFKYTKEIDESPYFSVENIPGLTIYYTEGTDGWTNPEWNGYPTATWVPGKGIAYPVEGGNIYFDKETGTIIGCDETVTHAEIPAEIDSVTVTSIGNGVFSYYSSLISVTIPYSVTSIEETALCHCVSLTGIWVDEANTAYSSDENGVLFNKDKTVLLRCPGRYSGAYTIPDSVTTIGRRAFVGCYKLTDVTIPDSVKSICDDAFESCNSLISVTIPDSVESIGQAVFRYCDSLNSVKLPNDLTEIRNNMFFSCDSLTSLDIPDSVTTIGNSAFEYCYNLTDVTIPDCVTHIKEYAFYYCGVTSLHLGKGVTRIDEYAFGSCRKLDGELVIPDNVNRIEKYAFSYCNEVDSIYIGNGVKYFGEFAFYHSPGLSSVVFAEGATTIGNKMFAGCENLTSVSIPTSVTNIGSHAFENCTSLTEFTLHEKINYVGRDAFSGCEALTELTVLNPTCAFYKSGETLGNSTVTALHGSAGSTLQSYAEQYGYSFTAHEYEGESCALCNEQRFAWEGTCGDALTWQLPEEDGILTISGNGTMYSFACVPPWDLARGYIRSAVLPEGLTNIGSLAFENCVNMKNISIPSTVSVIEENAFWNCAGLESLELPEVLTSIDTQAFAMCASVSEVTVPAATKQIGQNAFYGCSALRKILIVNPDCEIYDEVNTLGDPQTTVIYGLADSTAQTYADTYGYTFVTHEHSYTAVVTEPTCTQQGYTTYTCECGDSYVEDYIDALGHDYGEWTVSKTATCTEKGEERRDCSRCEAFETRELAATGHSYQTVVTEPTCTQQGYTTYTCECGNSYVEDYVDALGHDFGDWQIMNMWTCTTDGEKSRGCNRCYYSESETLPATGHDYEGGICTECGEKDPDYVPVEFNDVPENAWYKEAVDYAVENGLMNGMGDNKFEPETEMSRAMLVTVLWRYAGSPEEGENAFTDVKDDEWYAKAIAWAAHNNIVGGVGNGQFDPNGTMTREQLATVLYRYSKSLGIDVSKTADLASFPDGNKVSAYAKDALSWAVAEGLVNGSKVGNTVYLDPQGSATRAQVATILMRFIENVVE